MYMTSLGIFLSVGITLCIIVAIIMISGYIYDLLDDVNNNIFRNLSQAVLLILTISVCIFSIYWVYEKTSNIDTELNYGYSYDIYNLEDNLSSKGNRYYFEQDFKYYYMSDYKNGKKMYSVPKNMAYVVESNAIPHIETYYESPKNKPWFFWLFYKEYEVENNESRIKEYKIVIPPKSISNNYSIDMKN